MFPRAAAPRSAALRPSRSLPLRAFSAAPGLDVIRRSRAGPSTTVLAIPATSRCRPHVAPPASSRAYSQPAPNTQHEISPRGTKLWTYEQLQQAIKSKQDIVIIDTREPGELAQTGRIPGAINIPISTHPESFFLSPTEFEAQFDFPRPDPESEIVLYCKAGVRSRAAASLAQEAGWRNVGEYPGSWLDWEKNGGETK